MKVKIEPSIINVQEAINTRRGQYHSTRIIAILENHEDLAEFDRILGVTSLDLYNPSRRADGNGFVFGEARLAGRSGIVSTHRLSASSRAIFENRVKKEILHELGHMVGLEHCASTRCVMHQSKNQDDTDAKTDDYCESCEGNLKVLRH